MHPEIRRKTPSTHPMFIFTLPSKECDANTSPLQPILPSKDSFNIDTIKQYENPLIKKQHLARSAVRDIQS